MNDALAEVYQLALACLTGPKMLTQDKPNALDDLQVNYCLMAIMAINSAR